MRVALIDPSNFTLPYDSLLAKGLAANGCDVTIVKRKNRPNETRIEPPTREFLPYYNYSARHKTILEKAGIFKPVKFAEHCWNHVTVGGVLADIRPDVLHFQWLIIPWLDRRLLKSVLRTHKTVITVHDTQLYHGTGRTGLQARGWLSALNDFDHVIVHTRMSWDVVRRAGIDEGKIAIIPHGTIPVGNPGEDQPGNSQRPGYGAGRLQLLMFGFLKNYKGLETLATALERLPQEALDKLRITIAGKPHPEVSSSLQRLSSEPLRDVVRMDLKFLSDNELQSYLSNTDVVLFPYYRIDASGAFMATIPFGKIVLASKVGVFAETIVDGDSGILVEPKDPTQLAQAIVSLIDDQKYKARLQRGARALADAIPSWDAIGSMTKSIYAESMLKQ